MAYIKRLQRTEKDLSNELPKIRRQLSEEALLPEIDDLDHLTESEELEELSDFSIPKSDHFTEC